MGLVVSMGFPWLSLMWAIWCNILLYASACHQAVKINKTTCSLLTCMPLILSPWKLHWRQEKTHPKGLDWWNSVTRRCNFKYSLALFTLGNSRKRECPAPLQEFGFRTSAMRWCQTIFRWYHSTSCTSSSSFAIRGVTFCIPRTTLWCHCLPPSLHCIWLQCLSV